MKHNLEYIKDYYRWRNDVLKAMHKKRALAISKASKLVMFRKLGWIKKQVKLWIPLKITKI